MSAEQLIERTDTSKTSKKQDAGPQGSEREDREVYTRVYIGKEGPGAQKEKSKIDIKPIRIFVEDATTNILEILNDPNRDPNVIPPDVRKLIDTITDKNYKLTPEQLNQKVTEKLQSDQMVMLARDWQDEQLRYRSFALGFHWASEPEAVRKAMATPETIHTGKGEGVIHKANREIPEYIRNHPRLAAALTGLGATMTLGGTIGAIGPEGALLIGTNPVVQLGAGVAAGIGLERLIRHSANTPGEREIKSFCSAALRIMQQDREKAEYIKAVSGIDVDDFQITGENQIRLAPGRTPQTTRLADVEAEVKQGIKDRRQFWKDLTGNDRTDAMDDQFIYAFKNGQQEQTGSRMQKRYQELFQAEGGIQDEWGNRTEDPFFTFDDLRQITPTGRLPGTNAFLPAYDPVYFRHGSIQGRDLDSFGNPPSSMFYGRCSREDYINSIAGNFDINNFNLGNIPNMVRLIRGGGLTNIITQEMMRNNNVRDEWGQTPDNPYWGRRNMTGVTRGRIDFEGNLRRSDEAHKKAMMEAVEAVATEVRKKNFTNDVKVIETKISERDKPEGRVYKEKAEEIDKKKETIIEDRDKRITPEQQTQNVYKAKLETIETSRKNREELFNRIVPTAGGGRYPDINTILTTLRTNRNTTWAAGARLITVDGYPIQPIPTQRADEILRHTRELARIRAIPNAKTRADEMDALNKESAAIKLRIDSEDKRLEAAITEVEKILKDLDTAQKESADPKYEKVLDEREKDIQDLIDPKFRPFPAPVGGGAPPSGMRLIYQPRLTENDLRIKSVDDIMKEINGQNEYARTHIVPPLAYGWPESENNRSEHREKVLRAMAEARARDIDRAVTDPSRDLLWLRERGIDDTFLQSNNIGMINARIALVHGSVPLSTDQITAVKREIINGVASYGFTRIQESIAGNPPITENDLRILTTAEIRNRLTAPTAPGGAVRALPPFADNDDKINALRDEAQRRLNAHIKSTDQVIGFLNSAEQTQKEEKDKIEEKLKPDKEKLEVTRDLMSNVDKVYDLAQIITLESSFDPTIPTGPSRFLTGTQIDAVDAAFTSAERTNTYARGYYEILDGMFQYKKRPDREAYFKKISQTVPPDRLATLLNENLNFFATPPANLPDVLDAIHNDLHNNPPDLDFARIQQAFEHIVQTLYNEGIALS